jgi:hypothetical protein
VGEKRHRRNSEVFELHSCALIPRNIREFPRCPMLMIFLTYDRNVTAPAYANAYIGACSRLRDQQKHDKSRCRLASHES